MLDQEAAEGRTAIGIQGEGKRTARDSRQQRSELEPGFKSMNGQTGCDLQILDPVRESYKRPKVGDKAFLREIRKKESRRGSRKAAEAN